MSDSPWQKGGTDGREAKPRSSRGRFSPRFFVSVDPVPGERLNLGAEDSHHALKVLRLRAGDECEAVGPTRTVHRATVSSVAGPLEITVVAPLPADVAGPVYRFEVGLAQALARPAVMDYVLEKGTEVGADFFLLVAAAGSPGQAGLEKPGRLDRWSRVAREAAKQSKQTRVPWVSTSPSVSEALSLLEGAGRTHYVLDPGAERSLGGLLALWQQESSGGSPHRLCLWIGPEGGWTAEELDCFRAAGACGARLGQSVLRTETAGPVAVAITRLVLQDW